VTGVFAFLFYRKGRLRFSSFASIPMLAFYLSFVVTITVIARIKSAKAQYKLALFWSYKAIQNGRTELRAEIFWNIVLFIPIGILLSLILAGKLKWLVILISMLLSAGIEVTQLLFHRGLFEFDDIVHNTLGAVTGVLVFIVFRLITDKYRVRQLPRT
jgi:glycopeptide antibiotics resistance protein